MEQAEHLWLIATGQGAQRQDVLLAVVLLLVSEAHGAGNLALLALPAGGALVLVGAAAGGHVQHNLGGVAHNLQQQGVSWG